MSPEKLADAYRLMKTIREFEERMRSEYQQGKLPGFIHIYRNQEAIAVAACLDMTNEDYIASTHRGHGHCIAKGCEIEAMLLELACKEDGLCNGKGGSMHIADMSKGMLGANAIVGGGPPIAAGAALTAKTLGNGAVSMAFIGDGASDQGTVAESLNLAVVLQLCISNYHVVPNSSWQIYLFSVSCLAMRTTYGSVTQNRRQIAVFLVLPREIRRK